MLFTLANVKVLLTLKFLLWLTHAKVVANHKILIMSIILSIIGQNFDHCSIAYWYRKYNIIGLKPIGHSLCQ